jgi:hypothetical protein
MSIAIGLYDLFSYLIPGILYLYVLNETLGVMRWQYLDPAKLTFGGDSGPSLLAIALFAIGAYVAGHIFDQLRSMLLDSRMYNGVADRALRKIERRLSHSNIDHAFTPDDWSILQEGLKVRNQDLVGEAERFKAEGLMLRNLSFGLFLYGLIQLLQFVMQLDQWYHWLLFVIGLAASFLAHRRAGRFDEWFYRTIYSQALTYGASLKEFLNNSTPEWSTPQKPVRPTAQKKKQ